MNRATEAIPARQHRYRRRSEYVGLTSSDVEPILVVRSELLVSSGLDEIDPSRDLELTCRVIAALALYSSLPA